MKQHHVVGVRCCNWSWSISQSRRHQDGNYWIVKEYLKTGCKAGGKKCFKQTIVKDVKAKYCLLENKLGWLSSRFDLNLIWYAGRNEKKKSGCDLQFCLKGWTTVPGASSQQPHNIWPKVTHLKATDQALTSQSVSELVNECEKIRNGWRDDKELETMSGVVETVGACTYRLQLMQWKIAFHICNTEPRSAISWSKIGKKIYSRAQHALF